MSSHTFSQTSETRLQGVHPDLVRVMRRALELSPVDFDISEGLRTVEREKLMVAEGHSETMHSRHLTGHAVDVVAFTGGQVSWAMPLYADIAGAVRQAATELRIPVQWGGDWHTLKDGAHFQLPFAAYPA